MASVRTLVVFVIVILLAVAMFGRDINPRPCVTPNYSDEPFSQICEDSLR